MQHEDLEERDGDCDPSNRTAEHPNVPRKGAPERQQDDLKYLREADSEVEAPLLESVPFSSPIPALVDGRASPLPEMSSDPLFPEHRKKRGK